MECETKHFKLGPADHEDLLFDLEMVLLLKDQNCKLLRGKRKETALPHYRCELATMANAHDPAAAPNLH